LLDEEHFWIVAKYIEQNPIKAKMVTNIEDYKYQSLYQYLYKQKYLEVLENSKIFEMEVKDYYSFVNSSMSDEYLQKVYTEPSITKDINKNIVILDKRIDKFFEEDRDINRIENIKKAYNYGYSKADIARYLNLSSTIISRYLK